MLDKLTKLEKNTLLVTNLVKKIISLLLFKDHWTLDDENITFDSWAYKNTYQLLKSLINDGTLKIMTTTQ